MRFQVLFRFLQTVTFSLHQLHHILLPSLINAEVTTLESDQHSTTFVVYSNSSNTSKSSSEEFFTHLSNALPDARVDDQNFAHSTEDLKEDETFGNDESFHDPYSAAAELRMPLGGLTNLHHPSSCTRVKNVGTSRWLDVRKMVGEFLA